MRTSAGKPGAPKGAKCGRKRLSKQDRTAVSDRVREFISRQSEPTQAALARRAHLAPTTVAGWLSDSEHVRSPDAYQSLSLARETGVSLDWLWLGRGQMTWIDCALPPNKQVIRALEALALSSGEFSRAELWRRLTPRMEERLFERLYSEFKMYLSKAPKVESLVVRSDLRVACFQQQGQWIS
jgi:transcriptional regulator with XRE-family HTH domain